MKPLRKTIMEYAEELPEGEVIHAKTLLHLGSRAAIDKALSRLVEREQLLRVCRGFYVRLLEGYLGDRFFKYPPSAHLIVAHHRGVHCATSRRDRQSPGTDNTKSVAHHLHHFRPKPMPEIWRFPIGGNAPYVSLAVQRGRPDVRKSAQGRQLGRSATCRPCPAQTQERIIPLGPARNDGRLPETANLACQGSQ